MRNLNESTSTVALMGPMTPSERSAGRFLRAPDDHPGGTDSAPGNNGAEKPGGTGTADSTKDNTGQEFDAEAFWVDPAVSAVPSPGGGSSAGKDSETVGSPESQPKENDLGAAIQEGVKGFTAPDVMTEDAIKGIGEGDYKKFNENLQTTLQASMERTMGLTVEVIKAIVPKILEQVDNRIKGSNTKEQDRAALRAAIPSSNNAAVAPIVDSIYDRALILTKGDRGKAINMTKQMLASMAKGTATDVDLSVAPLGADSEIPPGIGPKINWLEDLNLSKT